MNLEIPKVLSISGKKWKVDVNKNKGGGWFDSGKALISIGARYAHEVPEIFVHELLEAILVANNTRYSLGRAGDENGDLVFVLSHREYEKVCADLAYALFEEGYTIASKDKTNRNSDKKPK